VVCCWAVVESTSIHYVLKVTYIYPFSVSIVFLSFLFGFRPWLIRTELGHHQTDLMVQSTILLVWRTWLSITTVDLCGICDPDSPYAPRRINPQDYFFWRREHYRLISRALLPHLLCNTFSTTIIMELPLPIPCYSDLLPDQTLPALLTQVDTRVL